MDLRKIIYVLLGVGISLSIFFFLVLLGLETKTKKLPVLGEVSDFHLRDTNSNEFDLEKLKGKIWVVDFMFTTCGNICPMLTKNMAALHRSFDSVDQVEMVSVSVNPENDSPKVLAEFAKQYHADTKKWHFLTGSREEIQNLAVNSFKIGSVDNPVFHSDQFVLVDKHAKIRAYYTGTEQKKVNSLFKDIASLMKEKD